jgi:hypothetical protein
MYRLTALSRNAHNTVHFGEGAWKPGRQLPFRIIWFPDAMVIASRRTARAGFSWRKDHVN